MNARYAIYFVPSAETKFYQAGTRLLGYDIRSQTVDQLDDDRRPPILLHFGSAHYFGFHATIRGTFVTGQLAGVKAGLAELARQVAPFWLRRSCIHAFSAHDRAIRFDSDPAAAQAMYAFHARAVRIVDTYRDQAYVSPETEAILDTLSADAVRLLRAHGDSRVLEGYIFHFTLANKALPEMLKLIDEYIEQESEHLVGVDIQVDRVCLVEQASDSHYWKIIEEYLFRQT